MRGAAVVGALAATLLLVSLLLPDGPPTTGDGVAVAAGAPAGQDDRPELRSDPWRFTPPTAVPTAMTVAAASVAAPSTQVPPEGRVEDDEPADAGDGPGVRAPVAAPPSTTSTTPPTTAAAPVAAVAEPAQPSGAVRQAPATTTTAAAPAPTTTKPPPPPPPRPTTTTAAAPAPTTTKPPPPPPPPPTTTTTAAPQRQAAPPSAPAGTSQEGRASWYDLKGAEPGVCAHRTIALGTVVRVTNVSNGKAISCRVGDRGPFVAGRILDLFRDDFAQLAPTTAGVITVRLEW